MDINKRIEIDFINKYLTDDEKKKIATRAFEEFCDKRIPEIIQARSSMGDIVDLIISGVVSRYISKLTPEFEDKFMKRIDDEINLEGDDAKDTVLRGTIDMKLASTAERYIDDHKYEIEKLMDPVIKESMSELTRERISYMIASRINMHEIIRQIISKDIKEKE